MANGVLTPLEINAAAGLMNNQGVKSLPTSLTTAIATFNGKTVIVNWLAAVNYYQAQTFKTQSTLDLLLSIGASTIPALGDAIPALPLANFPYLTQEYLPTQSDASTLDPYGFADLVQQTGNAYLGIYNDTRDLGKFCQGFMAMQGYITTTNSLINSTRNAATYLGPTFTNMSNLVSNNIASLVDDSPGALGRLATDIANQGLLTNTQTLNEYGTPAALLAQLSRVSNTINGTLPAVRDALQDQGLTLQDISNLVNINKVALFNPSGLTPNEFDKLQKKAYPALVSITDAALQDVLDILEVTTPNVSTMADLLNPVVMFPNSYTNLLTPSPAGPVPIYQTNGAVNMSLAETVGAFLPAPSGCDELAKIIPPDQAVSNKSTQAALQQITNIPFATWPELAQTIQGFDRNPWDVNSDYLTNDIVADAPVNPNSTLQPPLAVLSPATVFYQAIDDVPAGTNINNTTYWEPITLGGLNTMTGLDQIEALTNPVADATTNYINNFVATGSGTDGNITMCDVLGTAIDYNNLAAQFDIASAAVQTLQTAGALATLNTAYTNILVAANDAAVLTQITNANSAIATLYANPTYTATVSTLNTAWIAIATYLNKEKTYQVKAGVDYFGLLPGEQNSIVAFSQMLSQYGRECQTCGPYDFLQNIADTTTLAGQAMVGSLREGENQMKLAENRLSGADIKPDPAPPVPPACGVEIAN